MRPSPRDADMRAQDGMPAPCEFHVGPWIVIIIILALLVVTVNAENKKRSPRKPTLLSVARQARKAGIEVARYEIEPSGKIVVVTGKPDSADGTQNPWDEVLTGNGRRSGP